MAKVKAAKTSSIKVSFGKRKTGVAKKRANKHSSNKKYNRQGR